MKRIPLVLTAVSLLATPVVLAQSAPPSVPPSAAAPNTWFQKVEGYQLLLRPSAVLTGSFEDPISTEGLPATPSPVSGAFEDGTSTEGLPATFSPVSGSFEDATSTEPPPGAPSNVTGSFGRGSSAE
jgi:hypothetical protein